MSIKSISIPVSPRLAEIPETALTFDTLKSRAVALVDLQKQAQEATNHQLRDKILACVVAAFAGALAAAAAFAFLSNPITAGALIGAFVLYQVAAYGTAYLLNKYHHRDSILPKGSGAALVFIAMGTPYLIHSLITRKNFLQDRIATREREFLYLLRNHQGYNCTLTPAQQIELQSIYNRRPEKSV
ncbi:MAG TPA: hypothetical protein VLE89_03500 [Chlamydiales bacterium]|nr:hypothetical protein [Chlamydiales bacterium]